MPLGLRTDPPELPTASERRSPPLFRPRNAASEVRVTCVGSGGRVSIPNAGRLVDAVLERATGKDSSIHGESHWQRVAAAGLALLPGTPDADPALVFLFALFHNSMRSNDGYDPLHGPRGAALARELRGEAFDLKDAEMDLLGFACQEHTNGGVGSDPTVGVLGFRPVEPVAGGNQAGPALALDGSSTGRGAHRLGSWLAVQAFFLGGAVSVLRTPLSRIVRYYDYTTRTRC